MVFTPLFRGNNVQLVQQDILFNEIFIGIGTDEMGAIAIKLHAYRVADNADGHIAQVEVGHFPQQGQLAQKAGNGGRCHGLPILESLAESLPTGFGQTIEPGIGAQKCIEALHHPRLFLITDGRKMALHIALVHQFIGGMDLVVERIEDGTHLQFTAVEMDGHFVHIAIQQQLVQLGLKQRQVLINHALVPFAKKDGFPQ